MKKNSTNTSGEEIFTFQKFSPKVLVAKPMKNYRKSTKKVQKFDPKVLKKYKNLKKKYKNKK